MSDKPSTSHAQPQRHRKAKPTIDQLIDGRNRYLTLSEAVENAGDEDTIAIIPPDGSDNENAPEDVADDGDVVDVAGILEIIRPENFVDNTDLKRKWKRQEITKKIESGPRISTLSESHPILSTLSPIQLFRLYYTPELSVMIAEETQKYARQQGEMNFTVSPKEIDEFVLLLLYSSYVHLPRQEMYWERSFDVKLAHIHHGIPSMDQLKFLRAIVQSLTLEQVCGSPLSGPSGRCLPQEKLHLQGTAGKQGRCRHCKKTCKNKCISCDVMLHNHCSPAYHEKM